MSFLGSDPTCASKGVSVVIRYVDEKDGFVSTETHVPRRLVVRDDLLVVRTGNNRPRRTYGLTGSAGRGSDE